ncbi:MAG: hypothetical protein J6N53_15395 [Lachnospiraceae bacterium]|nr:hypothetical protein [Lachnospiraceae bacterium]
MNRKEVYYLIRGSVVGKQEDGRYYIFRNGKWDPDRGNLIMDRLTGYDPSEPSESPYRFGNGSVMAEMDEITDQRAMELIGRQQ